MVNEVRYKGLAGTVEFCAENQLYFGKLIGVNALVTYEGQSFVLLEKSFVEAVDDYLTIKVEMENDLVIESK